MGSDDSSTATKPAKARDRSALEAAAWEALGELFMLQRPRMMALCREFDLFPPQLMVLKALDRPRPMSDVAATLACDSSNLTGITDRLEERGLVRRGADEKDRRVRLLVLTDEGQRVRRQVVGRLQRPPAAIDALSDRDLVSLERLLRKALAATSHD
jgi:MarR family transcriptional regulator, organic hydroperoxide resistance regulator